VASKPKHALPEAELAAILGVAESTWKAHKAQGCPVPTIRSWSGLVRFLKAYHSWRRLHFGGDTEESPRRRHESIKADLLQIELDRERGRLVSRDEVVQFEHDALFQARQLLLGLPKKFASRLGPLCGLNGEALVEEETRREVVACLTAFARALSTKPDVAGDGPANPSGAGSAA